MYLSVVGKTMFLRNVPALLDDRKEFAAMPTIEKVCKPTVTDAGIVKSVSVLSAAVKPLTLASNGFKFSTV